MISGEVDRLWVKSMVGGLQFASVEYGGVSVALCVIWVEEEEAFESLRPMSTATGLSPSSSSTLSGGGRVEGVEDTFAGFVGSPFFLKNEAIDLIEKSGKNMAAALGGALARRSPCSSGGDGRLGLSVGSVGWILRRSRRIKEGAEVESWLGGGIDSWSST